MANLARPLAPRSCIDIRGRFIAPLVDHGVVSKCYPWRLTTDGHADKGTQQAYARAEIKIIYRSVGFSVGSAAGNLTERNP